MKLTVNNNDNVTILKGEKEIIGFAKGLYKLKEKPKTNYPDDIKRAIRYIASTGLKEFDYILIEKN